MDTRDALVVDAFAPGPMTGTPVGVVLDGAALAADQRRRMAGEFGAPVSAFVGAEDADWRLRLAGDAEHARPLHVGVAVGATLHERDWLEGETATLALADETLDVAVDDDGRTWVDIAAPDLREAPVTETEAAEALGVDPAAVRDVAADFPLVRASIGRGVLVVPVNFLEHLSGADPDPAAVADLLEGAQAEVLYAVTFDTLSGDRDAHGLAVDRDGQPRRATGEAEACAAAAIRQHGALDHERDTLRFEAGDLLDRPARLDVQTEDGYAVGGHSVTVLDGRIVVPPADEGDDIIEA
jgi:trans-2,3-dihydro-3-hydroxyanthranilate isomerase